MKNKYQKPKIDYVYTFLEECISSSSTITDFISIGGPTNSAFPDITDHQIDEEKYNFEF